MDLEAENAQLLPYQSKDNREAIDILQELQELAFKHPSYGFRKLFAYIRRMGKCWNHKKVYRVYKYLKPS